MNEYSKMILISLLLVVFVVFFIGCTSNALWNSAKLDRHGGGGLTIGVCAATQYTDSGFTTEIQKGVLPIEAVLNFPTEADKFDGYFRYVLPVGMHFGARFNIAELASRGSGLYITQEMQLGFPNLIGFFMKHAKKDSTESDPAIEVEASESPFPFEIKTPLYFSLFLSRYLGFTLAPGYIGRVTRIEKSNGDNGLKWVNMAGGNLNIRIGGNWGVILGTSAYLNLYRNVYEYHFGIGINISSFKF